MTNRLSTTRVGGGVWRRAISLLKGAGGGGERQNAIRLKHLCGVVVALFVVTAALAGAADKSQPVPRQTVKPAPISRPEPAEGGVKFLFLYKEGSVQPDVVKKMADALGLTIKEKSGPSPRATRKGTQPEGTSEWTAGDIEQAFEQAGYGAKLTKADAARIDPDTPLDELIKEYGPVVVFNIDLDRERAVLTPLDGDEAIGDVKGLQDVLDARKFQIDRTKIEEIAGVRNGDDEHKERQDEDAKEKGPSPAGLVVFTFNQTPESRKEFKQVFCKMYHNDCRGPIGEPEPLPDPVNIRSYGISADRSVVVVPAKFLFLYEEGSVQPNVLKKIADALALTIKEKSSPVKNQSKSTSRESKQEGKGIIIHRPPQLTIGDIEEAFLRAGYGVKLTKADAARINPNTPIEELFGEYGPVFAFNIGKEETTIIPLVDRAGSGEETGIGLKEKKKKKEKPKPEPTKPEPIEEEPT